MTITSTNPKTNTAKPQPAPKIPFDSLTLAAVASELRDRLVGGQIQDVRQPEPTEITLGIRSQNKNYTLVLSADPQFARVHLTTTKRPNSPTPPAFCMILRKYIENALILDIRQRDFDRILEVVIGTRSDGENIPHVRLVAELMGKHSNLILTTREDTILDAAKRITKRINRVRETLPGLTYLPPPAQDDRVDPFAPDAAAFLVRELGSKPLLEPNALADLLLSLYSGLSPFLAHELALRLSNTHSASPIDRAVFAVWQDVFGAADKGRFAPVLVRNAQGEAIGAYPIRLLQFPESAQKLVPELNAALDLAFTGQRDRARFAALFGEMRGKMDAEAKRVEKQGQSIARTLAEGQRIEEYKQTGELILANLWQIKPGNDAVTVQDYYDPDYPDRTIALDPTLTPHDNAEVWFKRYRKARDGQEQARQMREASDGTLYRLLQFRDRLDAAHAEDELRELRAELAASGLIRHFADNNANEKNGKSPSESEFAGHRIKRFPTPEGYEILVGESATANDYLTTRVARPNDWWLHVRAATSSHVVIRSQGKPDDVPRSVIRRAAELCASHSQQKHSSLVSVDLTLKKHVRKPRGSAPGAADYTHETTLDVTP